MVSIIMPAYNAEKYIKDAIKSVIAQTYAEWELIVIDDASSDNTGKIVQEIDDSRIRYIRNEVNLGTADSRNIGIEQAEGEWIAFLDSDDCWEKDKLIKQLKKAASEKAEFLFTGSAFMDEEGRRKASILNVPEKVGYRQLLKQNVISCSSVMVKKSIMAECPMHCDRKIHEDFAAWLWILKKNNIDAFGVNEPLLIYRISRNSRSGNKFRAAAMTFCVYRYIGLGIPEAVYYWIQYLVRSLKKYGSIRKQ